jgi:RHS repeat-associated protein
LIESLRRRFLMRNEAAKQVRQRNIDENARTTPAKLGHLRAVRKAGNRLTHEALPSTTTLTFTYDNIYELLTSKQGGTSEESYTYDPVGNRLTDLGSANWTYNTSNELNTRPNVSYSYDANGNTLTEVASSGTTTFAWDFENRLTSVALPGSGGTVTFKYDPFGRRIYKSSSSGTSIYAYDKNNLIEETNSSGTVVARYAQALKMDEELAMLRSGTTSYYEADGLGTATSLSNAAGALAQTYTFDSFGNLTASSGSLTNPFRFTGREWDTETNLQFSRFRYYDPSVGRFLTEDPLGFKAAANFYPYVDNRPTRYRDPLGLIRDCAQEQIDCFNKCYQGRLPWPFGCSSNPKVRKWSRYAYCQSKCLAEYLECEAENEGKKLIDACAQNPAACVAVGVGVGIIILQPETGPILGPVIAGAAH